MLTLLASKLPTVKLQECNSIKQIDQAKVLQSQNHLSLVCHKEIALQLLITMAQLVLFYQELTDYLFNPQHFITLAAI